MFATRDSVRRCREPKKADVDNVGESVRLQDLVLTAQTGRALRSWARAGRATAARDRIEEVFILAKKRDVQVTNVWTTSVGVWFVLERRVVD